VGEGQRGSAGEGGPHRDAGDSSRAGRRESEAPGNRRRRPGREPREGSAVGNHERAGPKGRTACIGGEDARSGRPPEHEARRVRAREPGTGRSGRRTRERTSEAPDPLDLTVTSSSERPRKGQTEEHLTARSGGSEGDVGASRRERRRGTRRRARHGVTTGPERERSGARFQGREAQESHGRTALATATDATDTAREEGLEAEQDTGKRPGTRPVTARGQALRGDAERRSGGGERSEGQQASEGKRRGPAGQRTVAETR